MLCRRTLPQLTLKSILRPLRRMIRRSSIDASMLEGHAGLPSLILTTSPLRYRPRIEPWV